MAGKGRTNKGNDRRSLFYPSRRDAPDNCEQRGRFRPRADLYNGQAIQGSAGQDEPALRFKGGKSRPCSRRLPSVGQRFDGGELAMKNVSDLIMNCRSFIKWAMIVTF